MGKKRKISNLAGNEHNKGKNDGLNILDDRNIKTKSKTNKKVKKNNEQENPNATENTESITASETPQIEESLNTNSKKVKSNKGKKKLKNTLLGEDNSTSVSAHENMISKRATKTRFVDNVPQVLATGSVQPSNKVIKKNNNQYVQQDEEEVNDEDIDKFCEELTAEDNVQFDNWVKLIEAKLHYKKNK